MHFKFPTIRTRALWIGVVAICASSIALATVTGTDPLNVFAPGDVVSASQINDNFAILAARITAQQTQIDALSSGGGGGATQSIFLATQDDIDALDGVTQVNGSLVVIGNTLTTVTLPESVQSVGGYIDVKSATVTEFHAPGLTEVGGDIFVGTGVQVVDLPVLTQIGGRVDFLSPDISTLTLPELRFVSSLFNISNVTVLQTASLPALEMVGGLYITNNSGLTTLNLPALKWIYGNGIDVETNSSLATLNLGQLTTSTNYFTISNNSSLDCDTAVAIRNQITNTVSATTSGNNNCH